MLALHRVSVYGLPVDWWLVGFFSFGLGIFHPWVNGYGDYYNVPIPAYPMGEGFAPFMYPWVLVSLHIGTLIE